MSYYAPVNKKLNAKEKLLFASSMKGRATQQVNAVKAIAHKEAVKVQRKASEPKHFEVVETKNFATLNAATSPRIMHISGIPQSAGASTDTTRIGDKVKIRKINLRMILNNIGSDIQADNDDNQTYRIMVVQDRDYNTSTSGVAPVAGGAVITPAQLLVDDPLFPTTKGGIISQRNVDHLQTLVVLYDKCFTTQYLCKSNYMLNINPKLKYCKKEIQYSNGSSVTNVTNGIYLMIWSSSTKTTPGLLNWQSRILFSDS